MNKITGEAIVSCYVAAAALLQMLLLLILSERLRQGKSYSMRIFFRLGLLVTVLCVTGFVYNAMYRQPAPWCHTAALIGKTLRECTVPVIVVLWLRYVYCKLYGEADRFSNRRRLVFLPLAVILVLLIVNLFTGIVFTYTPENKMAARPLLYIIFAVEFIYFASSAALVRYYDRKMMKVRFLRVSPMIVSVVLGSSTQFFAPYDIGVLGYVMGITLLYFSMISEIHFADEESGLYNKGYLAYLFDMAVSGKSDVRSALILNVDGNLPACFELLRGALHQNGDVVRLEEKKLMMFSKSDSRSVMQYLSSMVEEETDKFNAEHPDEPIRMTVRCRMRMGNEDAFSFLRAVVEEKEAGDTMRGVVSMMSELDRLDKELKLAADIQVNMLPMVFPAFPDRTEFDLFASMTPAKEVGGDFYDFFLIDRDHLALVIADVSGKGIPAALFMMVAKTLIKNQLLGGCDPAQALERVNLQLCERTSSTMFVTVWAAVLELSTGRGLSCNAGHENPCIRSAGGDFGTLRYRHDMCIGAISKSKYHVREFHMDPGDCLFVYTDGIKEAVNGAGEMFGEERLLETLNRCADAAPEEMIRNVRGAVDRFSDGAPQSDDITMLCMKYLRRAVTPAAGRDAEGDAVSAGPV